MGLLVDIVADQNDDLGPYTGARQVYVVNCPGPDNNLQREWDEVALQKVHTGEWMLVPVDLGRERVGEWVDDAGYFCRYLYKGIICGSFHPTWRAIVEPCRPKNLPSFCARLASCMQRLERRGNDTAAKWYDV